MTAAAVPEVFSVIVWSQPPGYDEDYFRDIERRIVVVAPTADIAHAAAMASRHAVAAQVDMVGSEFLRTGPRPDPYADCANPAAARARDRFLGSRTAEIMQGQGVGAVIAYRRALAELEEAP